MFVGAQEFNPNKAVVGICTTCFKNQYLLHYARTVHLLVKYDSHNKQQMFP
jgi:hypothetical protein